MWKNWTRCVRALTHLPANLMIGAFACFPALLLLDAPIAGAKTPGHTYCFYGTCHRVKTIAEMQDLAGTRTTMLASHYDDCRHDRYNPCGLTSSGEVFHADRADNAASPIYPDGTTLLVWSQDSKQAAVLRVNNAGPYWGKRTLDVSRATAERLGFKGRGVGKLEVRVLRAPDPEDTRYKKNRKYQPVLGYIGNYESEDIAHQGMAALMAFDAIAASVLAPMAGSAVVAARNTFVAPDTLVAEAAPQAKSKSRRIASLGPKPILDIVAQITRQPATAGDVGDAPKAEPIRVAAIETASEPGLPAITVSKPLDRNPDISAGASHAKSARKPAEAALPKTRSIAGRKVHQTVIASHKTSRPATRVARQAAPRPTQIATVASLAANKISAKTVATHETMTASYAQHRSIASGPQAIKAATIGAPQLKSRSAKGALAARLVKKPAASPAKAATASPSQTGKKLSAAPLINSAIAGRASA